MDIILNELSLSGQYSDITDFSERGLAPLSEIIHLIHTAGENSNLSLLKKSDFFSAMVTPDTSLYEILHSTMSRLDQIRKFKSDLAKIQNEPFWDMNQRHDATHDYVRTDNDRNDTVSGCAPAEAHARDGIMLSFTPSDYDADTVTICCNQLESTKVILNTSDIKTLFKERFIRGEIDLEQYFSLRFSSRFDFSEISRSNGFNHITNINFNLFESSFADFELKTWKQIIKDPGLDYKEFSKNRNTNRFFSQSQWGEGVFKFRIDQEKRCFGTRRGDIFYVWRIDLDHRLSDLG